MRFTPKISGASIVLVGSFNPQIFRPEWFKVNEIIGKNAADAAVVEVIHPQITAFSFEPISIRVELNRFTCTIASPPLVSACDLVLKTFHEFLIHTPVTQMGINFQSHYELSSLEKRNALGKKLAPWEPWGDWGKSFAPKPGAPESQGGLLSLWMQETKIVSGKAIGFRRVRVEPSTEIKNGVFFETNDHYEFGPINDVIGCEAAMEVLATNWESLSYQAVSVMEGVLEGAN
jgi:hypothetical protein